MTRRSCGFKAESVQSLDKKLNDESETDEASSKEQREIVITVESIENVDPCKAKEIIVRLEYMENILSESDPLIVKSSDLIDIGLEARITAEEITPRFLDEILANPVLFTVINSSASQPPTTSAPSQSSKVDNAKKKPLKTPVSATTAADAPSVLGVCNLDLGGLVMGKRNLRKTLIAGPSRKLPPEEMVTWMKLPKLAVKATIGREPLIPESLGKCNNVLGVTVECVYNAPEYIKEGTPYDASIPLPSLGEKNNVLVFSGGVATSEKEQTCKKKWLSLQHLEGQGGKSEYSICPNASDIINTLPRSVDLKREMKKPQNVIQWNTWRNNLMLKSDCNYFYSKLLKYRIWPVEVYLSGKSNANGNAQKTAKSDKKSKQTAQNGSPSQDHFTAFLDISSLLYPGVTSTRIAAQLHTYCQKDLINKFGADFSGSLSQPSIATVKSKGAVERSKASVGEPEEVKDSSGVPVFNEEGAPVFIVVEFELLKPLTAKRNPEHLEEELKSQISLKGKINKKAMNLALAKENYATSIKSIVSVLSGEYHKFCSLSKKMTVQIDDFDVDFQEFLCRQDGFQKVKATLENKTVQLINEKYGALSQFNEKIPEIFIYLVNEMHKITNGCVLGEEPSSSHLNTNGLQLYAEEALEEGEYYLAKDYVMLKLSRHLANPDYWLDCAVFFVTLNSHEAALEAVKEGLSLDPNHQIGLLMYGLIMAQFNDGDVAELIFQVLLAKYPDFVEGWTVLRMFYSTVKNYEGVYVAQQMATKVEHERKLFEESREKNLEETPSEEFCCKKYPPENSYTFSGEGKYGIASFKKARSLTEPLSWSTLFCPPDNINIKTAVLMLRLGFYEYASMCLAEEMIERADGDSPQYLYYHSVGHYLQGRYEEAIPHLETFVKEYGKDCFIWSLMGHCLYKLENNANAIACYEYVMESYNRPADLHLIYLRMGNFYLKAKKYSCAKKVFLTACKYSPSPRLWKGAGIACLRMEEAEDAEVAFGEASYLDNKDPETWAYLALANAMLRRLELFKHCYSEARKRDLKNQDLIKEIESCVVANGIEAEEC